MIQLRGLQRRGLFVESRQGLFEITDLGRLALQNSAEAIDRLVAASDAKQAQDEIDIAAERAQGYQFNED